LFKTESFKIIIIGWVHFFRQVVPFISNDTEKICNFVNSISTIDKYIEIWFFHGRPFLVELHLSKSTKLLLGGALLTRPPSAPVPVLCRCVIPLHHRFIHLQRLFPLQTFSSQLFMAVLFVVFKWNDVASRRAGKCGVRCIFLGRFSIGQLIFWGAFV
jgi:hypothetical protein